MWQEATNKFAFYVESAADMSQQKGVIVSAHSPIRTLVRWFHGKTPEPNTSTLLPLVPAAILHIPLERKTL